MNDTAAATSVTETPLHPSELPDERSEWPEQARAAFRDVLRQLDRWCREYDWPTSRNSLVAEEAIRQSW